MSTMEAGLGGGDTDGEDLGEESGIDGKGEEGAVDVEITDDATPEGGDGGGDEGSEGWEDPLEPEEKPQDMSTMEAGLGGGDTDGEDLGEESGIDGEGEEGAVDVEITDDATPEGGDGGEEIPIPEPQPDERPQDRSGADIPGEPAYDGLSGGDTDGEDLGEESGIDGEGEEGAVDEAAGTDDSSSDQKTGQEKDTLPPVENDIGLRPDEGKSDIQVVVNDDGTKSYVLESYGNIAFTRMVQINPNQDESSINEGGDDGSSGEKPKGENSTEDGTDSSDDGVKGEGSDPGYEGSGEIIGRISVQGVQENRSAEMIATMSNATKSSHGAEMSVVNNMK